MAPKNDPHLILIDGGPSDVYKPHLKPRILQIHEARGLGEEDPLPVDVVMVSHVDDDHIKGILDLTREQRGEPDVRWMSQSLAQQLRRLVEDKAGRTEGRSDSAPLHWTPAAGRRRGVRFRIGAR